MDMLLALKFAQKMVQKYSTISKLHRKSIDIDFIFWIIKIFKLDLFMIYKLIKHNFYSMVN